MNRPETLSRAAQAYLAEVDTRLRDVPPADHAALLADVEARLADLEPDGDPGAVLGPPAEFADDLRRAAGFTSSPAPTTKRPASLREWLADLWRRPAVAGTLDYLRSLRPAWWAVRGFQLATLPLLLVTPSTDFWGLHTIGSYSDVIRARGVNVLGGYASWWPLLLVVAFVVGSVVLGRVNARLDPKVRLGVVVLDVLAVFTLLAWPTWWLAPAFAYVTGLAG